MACGRLPSRSRRSDGPACRLRGAGRRGARAAGDGVQGAKRVNKNLKGRAVEAGLGRGRRPPSGTAMRSTSLPPGRAMRIRHSQICPRPLSRQESYRPPPPTLSPPTSLTPRNTAAAPAQPTRLRASPPGHTSASKRAQACLTAGKGLRARGRRCARRPSHGKADGKEGYSIQGKGVRMEAEGAVRDAAEGEGGAAKGTAGQGQTKRGAAGAAPLHTGTGTPARSCPERPQAATLSPNRASETLAACLTALLRPSRPFRPANLHGGKTETPWDLTTDWG